MIEMLTRDEILGRLELTERNPGVYAGEWIDRAVAL